MKSISLASVLVLVATMATAYAETPENYKNQAQSERYKETQTRSNTQATSENTPTNDLKRGLVKANTAMKETAQDVRAFFVDDDGTRAMDPVTIHHSTTAKGLLGQPVVDPNGKKITDLKDIIVDEDGDAVLAVVSDGGLLGIGNKVAAFDYDKVVTQRDDGKVVMALTQSMIDKAADFSYDRKDQAKAKVIPAGSYSIDELLDGKLLNNKGDKVGTIDNISFDGGEIHRVIVGFNKKLGMGGDLAALNYDSLEKIRKSGEVSLRMNAAQSAQFARLGKSTMR